MAWHKKGAQVSCSQHLFLGLLLLLPSLPRSLLRLARKASVEDGGCFLLGESARVHGRSTLP